MTTNRTGRELADPDAPVWYEEDVAARLGVSVRTVQGWRSEGRGPKFQKLGQARSSPVRYRPEEVMEWEETQRMSSTAERRAL